VTDGGPHDDIPDVEHPSDAFVRVAGATREELFAHAARACFALMTDLAAVRPIEERAIRCEGRDVEDLLAAWLNELIGIAAIESSFFCRFEIDDLRETRLTARAFGERIDPMRHPLKVEVKAATHHRLSVRRSGSGWEATVLLDL
jgi:SHS2 domain-containing protein